VGVVSSRVGVVEIFSLFNVDVVFGFEVSEVPFVFPFVNGEFLEDFLEGFPVVLGNVSEFVKNSNISE